MIVSALILTLVGLASIYSATLGMKGGEFKKQVMFVGIGLIPMAIFAFVNPRIWARISPFIYIINVLALAAVLVMGDSAKGAERWIQLGPMRFQPSEMTKLLSVLTLATFYSSRQDRIKELSTFLLGMLHIAVPAALIFLQPHLGATLLMIAVWLAMSLVAGIPPKFLFGILAFFVAFSSLVWFVKPIRHIVLRDYHVKRIEALLGGGKDVKGDDWQVQQGFYAFAAGGVAGTGYLQGPQKGRVPEQQNDFIFTVIGEEFGLLGCVVVLGLFALLFYRLWLGLVFAADFYYQMILAGILTVLSFQLFVNLSMVLKIIPVVGLWCPFLSSGGTALWLCMSMIGLAVNVRTRERAVLF
jgi:rod shape determining protein RodA